MMQLQQPNNFGEIRPPEGVISTQLPPPLASMDPSDHLNPIRDQALLLLKPDRYPARIALAVGALAVAFGLGWASGSTWHSLSTNAAIDPVVQKETSSRRPEMKSTSKNDGARKQPSLVTGAINSPKPQATLTDRMRADTESLKTITAAFSAKSGLSSGSIETRKPIGLAPETRPSTIEGWAVLDVRSGTAVLQGPDGIRMAALGDTVPGVGRIDSIVRWGNRWIVATANGLISTP